MKPASKPNAVNSVRNGKLLTPMWKASFQSRRRLISLTSGDPSEDSPKMVPPKFPINPVANELGRERCGCEKTTLERTPEQLNHGVPADVVMSYD